MHVYATRYSLKPQQHAPLVLTETVTAAHQERTDGLQAFPPDLQEAMALHMVPKFDNLRDLCAFACTCKAFRSAAEMWDEPWRAFAAQTLPPQHPALAGLDRAALQAAMQVLEACFHCFFAWPGSC